MQLCLELSSSTNQQFGHHPALSLTKCYRIAFNYSVSGKNRKSAVTPIHQRFAFSKKKYQCVNKTVAAVQVISGYLNLWKKRVFNKYFYKMAKVSFLLAAVALMITIQEGRHGAKMR